MCGAQVGARGLAIRTSGTSSFEGAHPATAGTGGLVGGAAQQLKGSCSHQALCQEPREVLLQEACRSPVSSSYGPLLPGIQRAELDGEQKFLVP